MEIKNTTLNLNNNIYSNKNFARFNSINAPAPQFRQEEVQKPKKRSARVALLAFIGAISPVILLNAVKKGRVAEVVNSFKDKLPLKDKFKAIWNMLEIENYSQILATTTGGVLGGMLGGLKQADNKEDKEAKYKEGIFEFLNNMTPTTLVALGTHYSNKTGKLKSVPCRAALILGSVMGGMFIANKTSNLINQKIFDKDKEQKDTRNFKPTDCLVHVDDLLNLAVLTKIPLANKFQIDKLLPLIYARSGYEAGMAGHEESKTERIR